MRNQIQIVIKRLLVLVALLAHLFTFGAAALLLVLLAAARLQAASAALALGSFRRDFDLPTGIPLLVCIVF